MAKIQMLHLILKYKHILDSFQKVVTPEMVEILKDNTAYENFKQITGLQQQ